MSTAADHWRPDEEWLEGARVVGRARVLDPSATGLIVERDGERRVVYWNRDRQMFAFEPAPA